MDKKICRFCGENHIPETEDICESCDALLNSTARARPPNPYDLKEQIDDTDEEGGL